MTKQTLIQVSQFCYPVIGGQERVVLQIGKLQFKKSIIVQPLNFTILKDLKKFFNFQKLHKVTIIPIPTIALFTNVFLPKKSIFTKYLNWASFNFSLKLSFGFISNHFKDNVLISHYHAHAIPLKKFKPIIFSHGIEWNDPPKNFLDKFKIRLLQKLKHSPTPLNVIANDNNFLNYLKTKKIPVNHSFYLPNYVDIDRFKKNKNLKTDKKINKLIVMVRNVRPDRGILEAIKAFSDFIKVRGKEWKMQIVGSYIANDRYYIKCCNAIKENKLEDNIKFLGQVNNSELPKYYALATFTLVPSQGLEGTSLSALESMATKTPCISTNIGGLKDIPTLKTDDLSSESLAETMNRLMSNYEKYQNEQYHKVIDNYSLEKWREQIYNFLNLK